MPDQSNDNVASNWTIDVQRGLAWTIVLVFAVVIALSLFRVVYSAEIADVNDMLKSALAVLFNIVMLVLGFFFGSSQSNKTKDDTQNKIIDKLTPPPVVIPPTLTTDQLGESMLTNGELTYFKSLTDEEAKKKFLAMSQAERTAAIGKV